MASVERGDSDSFKRGSLKRRLPTIRLAQLSSGASGNPEAQPVTYKLRLVGLTGQLNVSINAGVVSANDTDTIYAEDYPALPGTVQLVPNTNFPDSRKMYLRPVFQDPTSLTNIDAQLPQELPYGWEDYSTQADEVEIRVTFNPGAWFDGQLNGYLQVQVTIEWNGNWWDAEAVERAIARVKVSPFEMTDVFGTLFIG